MRTAISTNKNQRLGVSIYLSRFAALLVAISAFVLPERVAAEFDCNLCVHGGALLENVYGTNCLGQLVSGKSHPGETVFVRLDVRNVDCCPNTGTGSGFESPTNDWHLVTNVVDSVNFGCTNLQTANLIIS